MADDLDKLLKKTLKARIGERGWSLRETAERLSDAGWPVTHPMMQRLLNGSRKVTVSEWLTMAQVLSEPPLQLLLPPGRPRLPLCGRSVERGRLEEWIRGETPLDTVPDPDHYRRAAGRPSTRGKTDYAALLRHLADVYDAASNAKRADIHLHVLTYTTGAMQALRVSRRRRTKTPVMADFDVSETTPRAKRRRMTNTEQKG